MKAVLRAKVEVTVLSVCCTLINLIRLSYVFEVGYYLNESFNKLDFGLTGVQLAFNLNLLVKFSSDSTQRSLDLLLNLILSAPLFFKLFTMVYEDRLLNLKLHQVSEGPERNIRVLERFIRFSNQIKHID